MATMLRQCLTVLLLPLLPHLAACKKKPPPGGMPNIPGLGGLGGGPPWRKAIDKVFTEACAMNQGRPSVFCFPDKKELIDGLQVEQYGLELTDQTFLMDLHVVVEQLFQWPPAWLDVIDILSPKRAWTRAFCDKIVGGGWTKVVPAVRKSFLRPGHTLVQLEKDAPHMVAGMKRWLDDLKRTEDSRLKQLLKDFRTEDAADAKNKSCRARPLMRLMMHVHGKVIQHIIGKACKGSSEAMEKFKKGDENGLTLLHHVASLGDAAGAKAILKGLPKGERAAFLARRDEWGYSAEDWARLGDYEDLVEALRSFAGKRSSVSDEVGPPAEPRKLFPAADAAAESAAGASQCSGDDASETCSAASTGGWRRPTPAEVPAEWMPPQDAPCFADTIHVTQFNFDTFMRYYVLHPRPLLVRGGVQLPPQVLASYTRAGLLEAAGEQKITAQRFPEAKEYDGSKPVKKLLKEYVDYLDERADPSSAKKKLHFFYTRLQKDEAAFNFSATMPEILAGKVDLGAAYFYLGGLFMGTPLHHAAPMVDSLVHGAKLWLLEPPGREVVHYEAMYDYLSRTDGAPGASRCLQEAGDVLFVPRAWSHGSICLGDCVGAAHEFSHKRWDLRD